MKNTFCLVLILLVGLFFSTTAFGQGSGSTITVENSQQEVEQVGLSRAESPTFNTTPSSTFENRPEENTSFEVTRTVKGTLVKMEKGLLLLKTTKGELLNLKITPQTKIRSKKDNGDLSNGKLVRVSYIPETLLKKELEAVRVKILN